MLAAVASQQEIKYGLPFVPQCSYTFHIPPLFIQELVVVRCWCQRANCARVAKDGGGFIAKQYYNPNAFFPMGQQSLTPFFRVSAP